MTGHPTTHPDLPLVVGAAYAPKRVAAVYGGDFRSSLQAVDGAIRRAVVQRAANPDAPQCLLLDAAEENEDHPSRIMPRAVRLMREGGPLLVFLRERAGAPAVLLGSFVPVRLVATSAWLERHPDAPAVADDAQVAAAGADVGRILSGVLELRAVPTEDPSTGQADGHD